MDLFVVLNLDLKGQLEIGFVAEHVGFNYRFQHTLLGPTDFNASFDKNNMSLDYFWNAELNAAISTGVGLGLTLSFPAFKYKKNNNSYIGIYADARLKGEGKVSITDKIDKQICFNMEFKGGIVGNIYGESRFGLFGSKSYAEIDLYLLKDYSLKDIIEKTYSYCLEKPAWEQLPVIETKSVISITDTGAKSGGKITYDGGTAVTTRGICWSTSKNPTIDNNKTSDGTGTGEFTSKITNLTPNTTYYVRAYATNINGTAYGNEISFITQKNIDLPLKLSVSSLSLNVNATENIEVTSGNGSYTVVSSDANIATATISGSIITIKGITEGNTTVAVTDTQSKETATVAVTVNKVDVPPPTDRPKMAIEYFAEYNINKDGTGFVTDHNSDDMGFFNWYEAAGIQDSIYNKDGRNLFAPTGLLKDWRLPTGEEWMGLTGSFSGLTFNYSIHEAVTVGGVDKTYISDYLKSRGALTTFALRFKQAASERAPGFPPATDNSMLSAYRYDYVLNSENNKSKFYFKITVRYLGNDFTGNIDTISNYLFWQTNNSDDIIFILPTRGYLLPDNTTTVDSRLPIGYYWSNKHTNDERENAAIFGEQTCGPGNYAHKYLKYSIRPIKK